jgi:30S ribosomal protein S31
MGKGNRRSKRGKIYRGTYGKYRPRKRRKHVVKQEKQAPQH